MLGSFFIQPNKPNQTKPLFVIRSKQHVVIPKTKQGVKREDEGTLFLEFL